MIFATLALATAASAEVPTLPAVQGAGVRALVSRDPETGIYTYSYRLENSASGTIPVDEWTLDVRSDPSRIALSNAGLIFSPTVWPATEQNLEDLGPGGATAIGLPSDPASWTAGVNSAGFAIWRSPSAPLAVGSSQTGFVVTSHGAPGIRATRLAADLFDLLPNVDDPASNTSGEEVLAAIEASSLKSLSVGPVALPSSSTPAAFAGSIATLRTQAEEHGWIHAGPGVAAMDALLADVQAAFAAEDVELARSKARAFVTQVESISCATLDCPPTTVLTSEARALLALNMRYLLAQLPPPPTVVLTATADGTLRFDDKNQNEGTNPRLALGESGTSPRIVVAFDLTGIDLSGVLTASLVLNVDSGFTPSGWGENGGEVDAHRLLAPFTEGNGHSLDLTPAESSRGTGSGATWNCATDSDVANTAANCSPSWNGGSFSAAATSSAQHGDEIGGDIYWDVTADVQAGATSWLVKRRSSSGNVRYFSKEGAPSPELAPRLVIN